MDDNKPAWEMANQKRISKLVAGYSEKAGRSEPLIVVEAMPYADFAEVIRCSDLWSTLHSRYTMLHFKIINTEHSGLLYTAVMVRGARP